MRTASRLATPLRPRRLDGLLAGALAASGLRSSAPRPYVASRRALRFAARAGIVPAHLQNHYTSHRPLYRAYNPFVMQKPPASNQSRRQLLTLEAIDPDTGRVCGVMISYDRMRAVATRGMGAAKEAGELVPYILRSPAAIFEGLRDERDEDPKGCGFRCYCGIPSTAFCTDGSARRPYPGKVFLVFVNDQSVAYNWRWDKSDPGDPRLPADHATRFRSKRL